MAYEDTSSVDYTNDPAVTAQLWNQFYNTPQNTPTGFQFNQNEAMANALRGYGQDPYLAPVEYMPGYENTMTRKLLEKNSLGQTTPTTTPQRSSMPMPSMNMFQGAAGASGGTGFGTAEGSQLPTQAAAPLPGGESFGSGGSATIGDTGGFATGANSEAATAAGAEGSIPILGTIGGATAGYLAGRDNYNSDPNMRNGKDGYGKYHRDWRAEVGGGTLGGVMGMFGYGAAAYPAVRAAHYVMEPVTRAGINAGDKVGGVGGAMMVDPLGTASSGKYSWSDIGKGALLGPAKKWLGW